MVKLTIYILLLLFLNIKIELFYFKLEYKNLELTKSWFFKPTMIKGEGFITVMFLRKKIHIEYGRSNDEIRK